MIRNPTRGSSKIFPINKGFFFLVKKIRERSMISEYTSREKSFLFSLFSFCSKFI